MSDTDVTTTVNTGHFRPGNPGKPKGAKNKSTQLMEVIVAANPEALKEIAEKVIEKARAGTPWACELLFNRLWPEPKPRGSFIQFELPALDKLSDVQTALNAVLQAVADGVISIEEGEHMASMISDYAKPVIEQADMERRILEQETP
jgi:hypothetical protein